MEATYDIQAIEQGLRDTLKMVPQQSLGELYRVIEEGAERLHEPMQLAIIGKISSSKSTLVNAILGKQEIMATGQKEVTYNVGWLKHGRSDSPLVIHHKDGSPATRKSPSEFAAWTTLSGNKEIDNVSYIELFNEAEILRDINIIDTPGLDALRGKDSQNTLDFIQKVRPDAVIMLFTHAVSENVLDIVSQFNAGASFNPLNALGILSKIDVLWAETLERDATALQIGQKMARKRMKTNPTIKKTLFNIFPISALLFLAASTLDEAGLEALKSLAAADRKEADQALSSVKKFNQSPLSLSAEQRKQLLVSMDLYGIYLAVNFLREQPQASLADVRKLFWKESGAEDFMKTLHNHFGARAKLIKMEGIYQRIQQSIKAARGRTYESTSLQMLAKVEQRVADIFSSLVFEHREYELLNKIYHNEVCLDPEAEADFLALCGEKGVSAPERLGLKPQGVTANELLTKAMEKEAQWRREIALEPDPEEKEWMNTVLSAYTNLRQKIQTMSYQYEQAQAFLFNQ